jgi:Zn finger protein HypA/HybF involved in hydrogenase expression
LDKYYSGELRISSYKLKSILLREGVIDNICDDCGISSIWNGKELILHLDHIDGNSYNNKRDNLRMLCPNCHSQTSSYCGKNRTNMNLSDADYLENIPKYNNVGEMMKALNRRPQGHHYRKVAELMEKHNVAFKEGKLLETKIFKPKIKKEYKCGSCGNPITSDSKSGSCSTCIQLISRTIQRPPYEQLKKEIEETSYNAVGRKYGVSDNSIRKWIKYYEKYS